MRYELFVGTGPLSLKSHYPPPLAEPYRILFKSPYFPANNSDSIAMHFLRSHFNKIILTHSSQIICIDYHAKTLTESEARFFLKLSPLITSWSYF